MYILNSEAIFIKLGWLEISVFGHDVKYAEEALETLLVASRVILVNRRKHR